MKAAITILMIAILAVGQSVEVIPELKIGERTYKNAKFGYPSAYDIPIYHDAGISKVKLLDLPEPYRTQFPFRQDVADKFNGNMSGIKIRREKLAALKKEIEIESYKEKNFRLYSDGEYHDTGEERGVGGKVTQVLGRKHILVWSERLDAHVVLTNYSKAVFDGASISESGRLIGRFQYTSVTGAGKTVPLYDYGISDYKSKDLPKLRVEYASVLKEIESLEKANKELK